MVNYNLNPSTSPQVRLETVPLAADVKIIFVEWPSSPQVAGSRVSFILRVRNDGYDADIRLEVYDNVANELLWGIGWSLAHGEEEDVQASFTMPYRDIVPELRVGYATVVTDSRTGPAIAVIIADIPTSLTLALNPTTVPSGGLVTFSGKLSVQEFIDDLSGLQINIMVGDDKWAGDQTDAQGNFSGSFNAPQDGGGFAYAVYARFEGAQVEGLLLGAASSTLSRLYTSIPLLELKWWQWGLLLGWAAIGGVGLALGRKR